MSEGKEAAAAGSEGNGAAVDPTAVSLALNGASRETADAFLNDHRALIADQRRHLHEQEKQIHLDIAEKWLGVLLRVATLVVGLALAVGLAMAVWDASTADGTVVDAFSVPPQFAQAGVTGEVIASDLTERIISIRDVAQRNSLSSSREVRQASVDDVKVEIPETGISLGQAWRYLRLWLGNEHHLTGTLRLSGDGQIALTVAMDGQRVVTVVGASTDLEKLEQQAAEQIFASVDSDNIVLYLRTTGRQAEALAMAERNVQNAGNPGRRAQAYGLWASMTRSQLGNMPLAFARAKIGTDIYPKILATHREMMWASVLMGHDEDALHLAQLIPRFQEKDQQPDQQGQGFKELLGEGAFQRDFLLGDFANAATNGVCIVCPTSQQLISRAEASAKAHDGITSRALVARSMAEPSAPADLRNPRGAYISNVRLLHAALAGDWPAAVAGARAFEAQVKADPILSPGYKAVRLRILVAPWLAYVLARNGDIAAATAIIESTPEDCYDCIRTRGLVAAVAGRWDQAEIWFARAIRTAPSIPFAYTDWGQALLDRGKPDAAIEKFMLANEKGPHFADPLEGWGEALMAKNQSHLALAKFAEAEKYAPNWGRLHLKWGEALVYAGKKEQAKAQFTRAAQLDLTPTEKSELAMVSHLGRI